MSDPTRCPKCAQENIYFDGSLWNCPDCAHDWTVSADFKEKSLSEMLIVKDAFGNKLEDGDSVTLVKDLKIKGTSTSIKVGTKAKSIRVIDSSDGHNIACRLDGYGAINLKSEFVKKA